mgnify:CR=1 FL=1
MPPERAHHAAGGRRDVDDASELLRLHRGSAAWMSRNGAVEVHFPARLATRRPADRRIRSRRERGVVDQDVQPAEAIEHALHDRLQERPLRRCHPGTASAAIAQRRGHLEARSAPRTLTATDAPRWCRACRRGTTQSADGAGDEGDASRQISRPAWIRRITSRAAAGTLARIGTSSRQADLLRSIAPGVVSLASKDPSRHVQRRHAEHATSHPSHRARRLPVRFEQLAMRCWPLRVEGPGADNGVVRGAEPSG